MTNSKLNWRETSAGIYYESFDIVQFYDDWDHWQNGFCRLLEIEEPEARKLIESIVNYGAGVFSKLPESKKLSAIKRGTAKYFNISAQSLELDFSVCGTAFDGSPANTLYAASISGNDERLIVGNLQLGYAWQIDASSHQPITANSVDYDESYFEAPQKPHLGMRHYTSDEGWRMQKARRLFRTLIAHSNQITDSQERIALDVGSAASYFRMALEETPGWTHYGIDQSEEAVRICKQKFGFDTFCGLIAALPTMAPQLLHNCDMITLFDVIEHVDDPLGTIKSLKEFLSKDGVIIIRTPNLVSLEYELLGEYYYSFKLDHIKYFSPNSLEAMMKLCDLSLTYMETTSHLFKGLLGIDAIHHSYLQNTGADILSIFST